MERVLLFICLPTQWVDWKHTFPLDKRWISPVLLYHRTRRIHALILQLYTLIDPIDSYLFVIPYQLLISLLVILKR